MAQQPSQPNPPRSLLSAADHRDAAATAEGGLRRQNPWLTFLLPFIVYMLVGGFEPKPPHVLAPPNSGEEQTALMENQIVAMEPATPQTVEVENWFGLRYRDYAIVYTIKVFLTIAAILYVLPGYRQFPFHVSLLAVAVGVIGVVLWIGLCHLRWEQKYLAPMGLGWLVGMGERPAFNPFLQLVDSPAWMYVFLVIRFIGLSLVVPVIEEMFLRGFLMRLVQQDRWWEVPIGTVTPAAVAVGTLVPMMMHPGELLAAAVWFSLVTWLMVHTRNIWDCVAAHAVTNFLLGLYVVTQNQWQLW